MNTKRMIISLAVLSGLSGTVSAQRDSVALNEVVVTGTRGAADARHLPMTITTVSREQLTLNQQPSVLPTLSQQVPGLFVTSRGMMGYGVSGGAAGGINMRGISAGAGQMLVLIDGHPQYANIYGHPIADSYQTMMVERVEVLHGPASVLYGSNAMGGVINIVTRQKPTDGSETHLNIGAGSYGTVQSELSTQNRKGRFFSTVAVQYLRSDNHRPRLGFEQEGGYAKVGYDINQNWRTWAAANLTHFVGSNPGEEQAPVFSRDQWITRGEAQATLENHYEKWSGALSVYSNFGNHRIDDGHTADKDAETKFFRSKDALSGFSLYESATFLEGNRVTFGLDYQHIYGRAYYTDKVTNVELPMGAAAAKSHRNEVAAYIDVRQEVADWMTLDAGLRWDHHSLSGSEWVPQFGIVVRPMDSGHLKAMVSKGFRNPSVRELYLYKPANEDLKPERLWTYELSWRHTPLEGLTYGINLYYIKGDNMIKQVMLEAGPRNMNTGEIENYGCELMADYRLNKYLTLTTNHSLLHMKNRVEYAPAYQGFLGATYRQCRFSANVGLQYINNLYTSVADDLKESCMLVNATLGYQLSPQLGFWFRGENLLAQKYEVMKGFPMPRATFMAGVNVDF